MNLDRLRERAEEVLEAVAEERYLRLHDRTRRPRLGRMHADAGDLFAQGRISEVQRAVSESTGLEERRARLLLAFLVHGRARGVAAPALDERLRMEAHTLVRVGDRRIVLAEVPRLLGAADDPAVRREAEAARLEALQEGEDVVSELLARVRGVYEEVGHGSLVQSCGVLSELDPVAELREGRRLVQETDGLFRELLAWFLPRLAGVDPGEATSADVQRLEHAAPFAEIFHEPNPLRDTLPLLARTGVDPRAEGGLRVEGQPSLPTDRAECCVLAVPGNVVVVHPARPGLAPHRSAMRALGVALPHLFAGPDLPVELRWLGDDAIPLAYGHLLAGLLRDRPFLRHRYDLGRERAPEYLRLAVLLELLDVRRTVARLDASVAWGEGAREEEVADRYVEAMRAATGTEHDRREALWAVDLPNRLAADLRAHQLGALLADRLRDRLDEDWYRNPRAVELLLPRLREGRRDSAEELAAHLGTEALSFGPWMSRLQEALP